MAVINLFSYFILILISYNLGLISCITIEVKNAVQYDTEYIFAKGENVTFKCSHNRPIRWDYPHNKENITYDIIDDHNKNEYKMIINVYNIDHPAVGFYTCMENDNPHINKSLYLYVNGASKLFVELPEQHSLRGRERKPLVVPCRPTSPDIHVDLYEMELTETRKFQIKTQQKNSDGSLWKYDTREGFTWLFPIYDSYKPVSCSIEPNTTLNFGIFIYKYIPVLDTPTISNGTNEDFFAEEYPLHLSCSVYHEDGQFPPSLKWFKNGKELKNSRDHRIEIPSEPDYSVESFPELSLKIRNLDKSQDEGKYTCMAYDNDDENINSTATLDVNNILNKGKHFINIFEENNITSITVKSNEDVIWSVNVSSFPRAEIEWIKNNEKIRNGGKYKLQVHEFKHSIIISNTSIDDMANYTIKADNHRNKTKLTLQLIVKSKPQVKLDVKPFNLINTNSMVNCLITGYPQPDVLLFFKGDCADCEFEKRIPKNIYKKSSNELNVTMVIQSKQSGTVKCIAKNSYGSNEKDAEFVVSDVEDGFQIWIEENGEEIRLNKNSRQIKIAVGDDVNFYCAADTQKYPVDIDWTYNNSKVPNLHISYTTYSKKIDFSISKINKSNTGEYSCIQNFFLIVTDPEPPRIKKTNLNEKQDELIFPNPHELYCNVDGIPRPKVTWQKDGQEFIPDGTRIKFTNNNQKVVFNETYIQDEGTYQCTVTNKVKELKRSTYMGFKNREKLNPYIYGVIAILVVVTLIILLCLCLKIRKENELKRVLRSAGLEHFEKGQIESINPEIGIDEQAELLPYHKDRWEIPREHIKLGKQLGAGAFGVVMKGEAIGLSNDKETTIVAVKMVKKNVDFSYLKALSSELKIMGNLGQHINVVNLHGACTKNIAKGELLVVVEFCRFGNIHNYLLRHRVNFVNQIDPDTNIIDYNIGAELLERSFSISSSHSQETSNLNDMQDYRDNYNNTTAQTQYTATTTVCTTPTGQDEPLTSSNSVQPEWRSNYKGDYKGKIKPICTKDLITWAFQVARGMEYLASRKVLHGDLAARNILLSDNNIIKICDFGLAKQMYKDDNYKKQHNSPLPIKWMAIESITDRVFSTQSDVWSYGIVMWELFSLAKTPYPGMEADEKLYHKLVNGYRMECPPYATPEIYDIMSDCWHTKPMMRPAFTKLAERIGNLLEQAVLRYYIDLNDPYLQMNTKLFQELQSDYLQMASPQDFQSLSTPQYINYDSGISSPMPGQPYMLMKPAHIFSPRTLKDGEIFTFDDANKKRQAENECLEMTPMLNLRDLNNLSKPNSPEPEEIPSFSNPSYNKMPLITENIKTKDNYVNMPQNKSISKIDFVNDEKNKGEHHYVNNVSRDWERDVIMA